MMSLPKHLAELAWQEIHEFEREKGMPLISTAERVGLEKGLAEGLAKGLAQAREDLLTGIEGLLDVKFGAAGLALLPEIQQLQDLDLLRKILRATKQADSPEALRQLWAKQA